MFDIDNVYLPNTMMNLNYKLDMSVIRPKEVPTPKWRLVQIEPSTLRDSSCEEETLDDAVYLARHEKVELSWRYRNTIKWINARSNTNGKKSSTCALLEAMDTSAMSVEELRSLMQQLETTEFNNNNNHRKR